MLSVFTFIKQWPGAILCTIISIILHIFWDIIEPSISKNALRTLMFGSAIVVLIDFDRFRRRLLENSNNKESKNDARKN